MINIYDFDDTIFAGDSTARFCRFVLMRKPGLFLKLPAVAWAFARYAMKLSTKTEAKQTIYRSLLPGLDLDAALDQFWQENMPRVKGWYLNQKQPTDIVISASPKFLLEIPCKALGIAQLIASPVDPHTGKTLGENCHGEEKVLRYRNECPKGDFAFYSDSLSDLPMARLAKKAYWVRGDSVTEWKI